MARLNPFGRRRRPHRFSPERIGAQQVTLPGDSEQRAKQMNVELETWQKKILVYANLVPEVMTGYSFVNNVLNRIWYEIEHYDRIENEWVVDDSPEIQGVERRINNGFSAGRAGALLHLIEECYILTRRTEDLAFEFETLAATEIRFQNGRNEQRELKDGTKETWVPVPEGTTVIRVFTPDPANRELAGGPHKAMTGLLELMALELQRDQATAISVLAGNGILYIPTEILPDESYDLDSTDAPGSREMFENRLEEGMTASITDRNRADAVVPLTLYGPAEYGAEIRHVLPERGETSGETGARMDSYRKRYAQDIDLPAQIILGIGDGNHWTDWKVDENTWAYHLEPRAERIGDALYVGLVSRILENLGLNPAEYRLVPNASKAVAQQDKSGTATEAYKLGAIKIDSYLEALGFDPSDARDDAEELLLDIITGGAAPVGDAISAGPPDRTAAAKQPKTILRGASNIANKQQKALNAMYRRLLGKMAEEAGKAGARAKRERLAADKTAAGNKDYIAFQGYEPGVYFRQYQSQLMDGTNAELFKTLKRIATLTGLDYGHLKNTWSKQFDQRAASVLASAETEALKIEKASFKAGKPARVTEATVRTMTSTANGGSVQHNGRAGNTNRPPHAANDPMIRDAVTEAVGSFATEYTWIHDEPNVPFEPHVELDGRTWFSWEEGDALENTDSFPEGSTYFPGDHDGCLCEYSIEFVQVPAGEGESE